MTNNQTKAIIYKPTKTAMQSGKGKTKDWLLEYKPESKKIVDNLIGWQGSSDMKQEIKLRFETKETAIAYAEKNKIPYEIHQPKERKIIIKQYADNFQ
jgi:hypothetical protein